MKIKPTFFCVIFIIFITFIFFHKFFINGLIPIPSDIPTGMYYPWINHNFGYQVKVPVKNPILTDSISQFWIWRNWAVENLKHGQISFWNPYSLAGYPMSPWFHTILFSPVNFVYFIFTKTTSMSLIVISQLLISLIGMFLFTKKVTSSNIGGLFGSISFTFSSFFIGWLTWGTISWTLAFLPLILLGCHQILYQNINFKNASLLFFSTIFSLLGGHPQTFLYVILITVIYLLTYIFTTKKWQSKISFILITFFCCFISTTFVTIPSIPILQNSIRESENYISSNNFGFIPSNKLLINFVAPDFFGNPGTNNYWGGDFNYQEKLVWYGTCALFLTIFYFLFFIKNKKKVDHTHLFLFIIFFLGILLTIKYPVGILVYKLKLPLISTSSAGRSIILSIFSGSILASLGISNLIKNKKNCFQEIKKTAAIFFLFNLIIFSVILLTKKYLNPDHQYNQNLNIGLRNLIIPFGVIILTSMVSILICIVKKPIYKLVLGAVLVAIALTEGIRFGWKYTPFTPPSLYFPKTESLQFLESEYQKTKDIFRIERDKSELLPPNMWQAYNFYSSSGYDPITPNNFSRFLVNSNITVDPTRYIEYDTKNLDFISELGTKYFLTLKRDKNNNIDAKGNISKFIDTKKWQNVFQEGPVVILENKNFSPVYFLKNTGELSLIKKYDNYWEFKVTTSQDNQLIVLENSNPNWKATINNQPVEVNLYKNTFKSLDIKSGESIAKLFYSNKLFNNSTIISITGFFIGLISLIIYLKKQKKHE